MAPRVTLGFKARLPICTIRSPAARSPTSSSSMALHRLRSGRNGPPGKSFCGRIGSCSPPQISSRLTCGHRVGLPRYAVPLVMELGTRRIEIAGMVSKPDGVWVTQCGRKITDTIDGCVRGKRFLLHDRDPLFSKAFRETLTATGVETVRVPPRSPNLNAYAERFVRSIKESCLDRMILFGEGSLRRAIRDFSQHCDHERNHQGLGNQLILPVGAQTRDCGRILSRNRL